jgi:hypothetical protein
VKFNELHELIPHVIGKKEKVLSMSPYNAVTLRMPGRHQKDTPVPGGDFVVCVDDADLEWVQHQFTHVDLFRDLETKAISLKIHATELAEAYLEVITGADPEKFDFVAPKSGLPGLHPKTFLFAVQCLGVAEHRRYGHFEKKFGGRYLPFRFSAGIVEGLWTATEAADKQKYGRPAVERLELQRGVPALTKELMK